MKKREIIILLITIALVGGIFGYSLMRQQKGAVVLIKIDGEVVEELPLEEDTVYEVTQDGRVSNVVHIEDSQVWITDADCPDKLCENMGKVSKDGQTLVCLPNKVIVQIEGGEGADIDMVAQ